MNTQQGGASMHQGSESDEEAVSQDGVEITPQEETAEVDEEIQEVEKDVEAFCLSIEGELDSESREKAEDMILERLDKAVDSWARVEFLSKVADWGCLDALVGVIFPEVGDAAAAAVEIGYLLSEANIAAKMDWKKQTKVTVYQLVDLAIGLVPIIGDAGDLVFMANRMSAKEFRANVQDKANEAIAAGVPKEKVDNILAKHDALMKNIAIVEKAAKVVKKQGGSAAKEAPEAPTAEV